MVKKYELPENKPQMVSEPVAAYALQEQPVMHVLKKDFSLDPTKDEPFGKAQDKPFDLTEEQVTQILDMSDKAFAHGKVYSHAEVMNRVRHYEYGHSLV